MKKKIIKNRLIFIILVMLCIPNITQASELKLNNLTYEVQLNEDGSANIIENWKIYIEDTNTLFKTFEIDKTKYKEITNVKVYEIENLKKTEFKQIQEEKYHVDKNCFYALMNKKGQFEIAWGVNQKNTTRSYQIEYKVVDAVKNYQDCSEFYWQFINNKSEIPATMVNGSITLPNPVTNKEDLKVWAHGPLNGNINIVDESTISFEVISLAQKTMLETRIVTPNTIYPNNANVSSESKLNSILTQEQQWAEEANRIREKAQKQKEMQEFILTIAMVVLKVVFAMIGIVLSFKFIKYHQSLKETQKIKPEQELEYYREIPDEKTTPAQAAFLYYFNKGSLSTNMSNVISATMLELARKGYITFEMLQEKKKEVLITVKQKEIVLAEDETMVLNFLKKVAKTQNQSFTMKDFSKYINKHAEEVITMMNKIQELVKKEQQENGNYDEQLIKTYHKWVGKAVLYAIIAVMSIFILPIVIIPAGFATIYSSILANRYNTLTQKGENEKQKWTALKRYMEEFSMMKDKKVPELILWEKYLVFATAFGIADQVLKQLKVVYPQLQDSNTFMGNNYALLYVMCHANMNTSFTKTMDHAISSAYSSGSGQGGGFSVGGGFGGGGGRNGRKIDNKKLTKKKRNR